MRNKKVTPYMPEPLTDLNLTTTRCEILNWELPDHKTAFIALMKHYSADPMGGNRALSHEVLTQSFEGLKSRDFAQSFLAFHNNTPIGLANCLEAYSTFKAAPLINIHDFIVLEVFRRKGVSQLLLKAVEEYAQSINACKITLEVLSNNPAAQKAYRRFGFDDYALAPDAGTALFWQKNLTVL